MSLEINVNTLLSSVQALAEGVALALVNCEEGSWSWAVLPACLCHDGETTIPL